MKAPENAISKEKRAEFTREQKGSYSRERETRRGWGRGRTQSVQGLASHSEESRLYSQGSSEQGEVLGRGVAPLLATVRT